MAFKNVSNSGISDADLRRGYSDTGAIPDEYANVQEAEAQARKEAKHEREEKAMAKKYGWDAEPEFGGFLDRDCD